MMRFEGRTAIVTGGSRGIGRACAARLAREGAKVACLYQSNQAAAESLVEELKDAPGEVHPFQADVRDGRRAAELVDQLFNDWGRIDVLVNSAGIVQDGLLGAMTDQQWRDVIETNLGGTYNYCHAVVQPMMMQRSGSIVNLSSTAAEFASRGQVNYAASKGGINGLTRALAKELAPRKVRVNAVAPGMIETDMSQVVRGIAGDQIKGVIPMKRIGKPEEVASVAAFLASDDAAYLTGQVIRVDGGLSLGGY
jgi:3-oxoacyl-[acyl-carrier protein] reductase